MDMDIDDLLGSFGGHGRGGPSHMGGHNRKKARVQVGMTCP